MLGNSLIKQADLVEIICQIFEDEYEADKIKKRAQGMESRRTFDFSEENIGMESEVSSRIFQTLIAFVTSEI